MSLRLVSFAACFLFTSTLLAAPSAKKVVGQWKVTAVAKGEEKHDVPAMMSMVWKFAKTGTATMTIKVKDDEKSATGKWKLKGSELSISLKGKTETFEVEMDDDDSLQFKKDGKTMWLKRVEDE